MCMLLQDYASDPIFQRLVKTFDSFWDEELSADDAALEVTCTSDQGLAI